ncbi:MAG TPA: hypothetical protein DCF73_18825, partial [Rhodobiaceae bacterium]|nr:hypothetical protein [Rhodobiaceae bacterium]
MFPGIGVAVALAAMLVAVPDTQALTLEDAMSLAVSEHPGAKAAQLEAEAAEREIGSARSGY